MNVFNGTLEMDTSFVSATNSSSVRYAFRIPGLLRPLSRDQFPHIAQNRFVSLSC